MGDIMEESYVLAKKVVTEKYGKDYKYFSLLTLVLCAILNRYKEHTDDIVDLFNRTMIYIDNDSLYNISRKNKLEYANMRKDSDDLAISYSGFDGYFENNEFIPTIHPPLILCDNRTNKTLVLNVMIHELNHLVKGIYNNHEIIKDEDVCGFSVRTGIDILQCLYNRPANLEICRNSYGVLYEAINVLETGEMTKNLLQLDGIIPDEDIKEYFDELDKDLMLENIGYEFVVKELTPLWANDNFRSLIEDNIYEGNLVNIVNGFEEIMGNGSFERFTDTLDDFDEAINNNCNAKKRRFYREKIRNYVNKYNNLTKFVYKK